MTAAPDDRDEPVTLDHGDALADALRERRSPTGAEAEEVIRAAW